MWQVTPSTRGLWNWPIITHGLLLQTFTVSTTGAWITVSACDTNEQFRCFTFPDVQGKSHSNVSLRVLKLTRKEQSLPAFQMTVLAQRADVSTASNQWLEILNGRMRVRTIRRRARMRVYVWCATPKHILYNDSPARLNASKFFVTSWWPLSQSRNSISFIELKGSRICLLFAPYSHLCFFRSAFQFLSFISLQLFHSFHFSLTLFRFFFFVPYFLLSSFYSMSALLVFFLSAFLTFIRSVFLKEKLFSEVRSTPYW